MEWRSVVAAGQGWYQAVTNMMMMMIMAELIKPGTRLYYQYDDDYGGVDQAWYQAVSPI
jgi:hypothetical protein